MNVWFFGSYDQFDGESNRTHLFAKYLATFSDFKVSFFCNSFCHFTKKQKRKVKGLSLRESRDSVDIYWLKTPGYYSNGIYRFINMICNFFLLVMNGISVKKSPDIIIGSSVPITTAFAALLVARLRRAKFVYEIRDLWPEALVLLGGIKRASFSYIVMKCIERLILRSADLVISALPSVESYARMSGLKKRSKIIWIPNPVSPPSKYETTNYLTRFAGFNVVYIGGFGRFHDIDVILRAAKQLINQGHNDVNIHLFGSGEFLDFYKTKAKHDFLINIYFHGRIAKSEVWGVQKEADALLATIPDSDIFKYGINTNKVTNYMIAGKPILYCGPNLSYSPVRDSCAGFCSLAGDAGGLAMNIIELKGSNYHKYIFEFKKNAEIYYKKNFDLILLGKRYRNALLKIYNSHTS